MIPDWSPTYRSPGHRRLKKITGCSCSFTNLHQNQVHFKGNIVAVSGSLLQSQLFFLVISLWHSRRRHGIKRKHRSVLVKKTVSTVVLNDFHKPIGRYIDLLYYFHPCLHFHLSFRNKNKVKRSQLCVVAMSTQSVQVIKRQFVDRHQETVY